MLLHTEMLLESSSSKSKILDSGTAINSLIRTRFEILKFLLSMLFVLCKSQSDLLAVSATFLMENINVIP